MNINKQYDDGFMEQARIGSVLRVRMPQDYIVSSGPGGFSVDDRAGHVSALLGQRLLAPVTVAFGAAAVLYNNPVTSRRSLFGFK